jgi:hypothetical protein
MGRYYSGDIEGKFWFAVQSSNAASRFGGVESEPSYIDYYFDKDHLQEIEGEINRIENSIDVNKLDNFFSERNGYNDNMLREAGITDRELSEYADLELGRKILNCVKENGSCSFEAEL